MNQILQNGESTGAKEFHLTGRKFVESRMMFRSEGIPMGGFPDIPEYSRKVADPEKIRKIIKSSKGFDIDFEIQSDFLTLQSRKSWQLAVGSWQVRSEIANCFLPTAN